MQIKLRKIWQWPISCAWKFRGNLAPKLAWLYKNLHFVTRRLFSTKQNCRVMSTKKFTLFVILLLNTTTWSIPSFFGSTIKHLSYAKIFFPLNKKRILLIKYMHKNFICISMISIAVVNYEERSIVKPEKGQK